MGVVLVQGKANERAWLSARLPPKSRPHPACLGDGRGRSQVFNMAGMDVEVAPAVLIWARESIGLSREQAAAKIDVFPSKLRYWEEGHGDPTLSQLRRLAETYQRPLAALFLSEPPTERDAVPDYRLMSGNHGNSWSPALHEASRRVRMQREVAIELAELREEVPTPIEVELGTDLDPERAGELVRGWLGIPAPTTVAVRGEGSPLKRWSVLVEAKSILVTQIQGVALDEMRGLSISEQPFPVIVLNGKDAPGGKLFTLLHELVHVLLRSGGLCDLREEWGHARTPSERVERYCNHVAAVALMPQSALLTDPRVAAASTSTTWADADLRELSHRFGVSDEAMLLRLAKLHRASEDDYRRRRKLFLRIYAARRERQPRAAGGPGYYQMKLRDFGGLYVRAVLNAYREQDITGSEVADYLDMKLDHVAKLERLVEAGR